MQKGFLFDLNKCTGCNACQIACSIENEVELPRNWRQVRTFNEQKHPDISYFHLSSACHHCLDPSCMKYCPALAIQKDQIFGAVIIDQKKCIGCKYCSWVCPYDAPVFNDQSKTMEKCTFCHHRLQEELLPACISLCPTSALQLSDFQDEIQTDGVPGFTASEIKPAIKLIRLRENQQLPKISDLPFDENVLVMFRKSIERIDIQEKIHCLSEWPLVFFSVLMAFITGSMTAGLILHTILPTTLYIILGIIGIGISALHLGKISRAHRALLNLRYSWLSREVLFYILFLILLSGQIIFSTQIKWLAWLAVAAGFLTLFSIEKVYTVVATIQRQEVHSANVLLTGFFLASLFSEFTFGIILFGGIKFLLYIRQSFNRKIQRYNFAIILGFIRVLFGFLIPAIFWFWDIAGLFTFTIILILIAELIDRCEFYENLTIITPAKQMVFDLEKSIKNEEQNTIKTSKNLK